MAISAAIQGRRLVSGILWYANDTPDADGWLPTTGRGQAGGHAIKGWAPAMRIIAAERPSSGVKHRSRGAEMAGPWSR